MANRGNIRQVVAYLRKAGGDVMDRAKDEVQATGLEVRNEAMRAAPVDLGKLRQSIQVNPERNREAITITAGNISDNSRNYAAFVEFGTGRKVQVPRGFEKMAMQFKGRRQVQGMRARPYLVPAFNRGRVRLYNRLKRLANEVGG